MGRMALFSDPEPEPVPSEPLLVECSRCLKQTPISPVDLALAALPVSLHLPVLKRYHSYLRCPACHRRAWVRIRLAG